MWFREGRILSYHSFTTFAENTTEKCGRTEKQNPTEFRELALCWLPIFFCQRKIKGYRNPIRRSVPYFFLVLSPRIAQERRLGFGSVVSPVKRLNALRAVYGLLLRLVKSGAFAVSVWIAVSQPIATDFHCTTTVLAETFPSGFIAGDPFILHWLDYF